MDERPEVEVAVIEAEEEETYHNPDALFRIATWANIVAWVTLIVGLVLFVGRLYLEYQQGAIEMNIFYVYSLLGTFFTVLIATSFFFILRALSEAIYLLLDVHEGLRG